MDDGAGEAGRDVYEVAPLGECSRTWLSDSDLFEARARFGEEAILDDDGEGEGEEGELG